MAFSEESTHEDQTFSSVNSHLQLLPLTGAGGHNKNIMGIN